MLFYSREIGRDGEKDYLDTADFRDVFFEQDSFNCISDKDEKATVTYSLYYQEEGNKIGLEGTLKINGETIIRQYEIKEPYLLVEQGAEAYYDEKLIDEIDVIREAKSYILNEIQSYLLEQDYLLVGTTLDAMALLVNNGNTVAALDNINVNSSTRFNEDKFYSILELSTLSAGQLSVYITEDKRIGGDVDSITINNGKVNIELSSTFKETLEEPMKYIKASLLKTREEYDENRAQYIQVESSVESDFDEFDDLF